MRIIMSALVMCLVAGFSNVSLAAHIPVEFSYGWGAEVQQLASVPVKAPLAANFGGSTVHISYKWDQLWFGLPFWTANGGYILEVVSKDGTRTYFQLQDQDPGSIAASAGIEAESLGRPFFSWFPAGYICLFFAYVVATMISGPSPKKRFARLIHDSRYERALGNLAKCQAECTSSGVAAGDSATLDKNMEHCYAQSIDLLIENGVSRSMADRNLLFMIGYLQKNLHEAPTCITS